MTLEEKKEVLKEYFNTFQEKLKEGDFIDAVDSVNKWCLATVLKPLSESFVRVHFDGWSQKWDTHYRWNSYKWAPFRRNSQDYTGQQGVPLRQNMSYDIKLVHYHKNKVDKIVADNFARMSA